MTSKLEKQLRAKIEAGENPTEIRKWIRKNFNVQKTRGNQIYNEHSKPAPSKSQTQTIDGDVETLEDLIRVRKIDLDVWEPVSFRTTSWDNKHGVRGEFRRKVEEKRVENLLDIFQAKANEFSPKKWSFESLTEGDYMYVLGANDLHLAKLAWDKESGQNYDINIAKKIYKEAIEDLMLKARHYKIEKVVLIAGSDFFQFDTRDQKTSNGTFVDCDSRWTKMFSEGCQLMTDIIEQLSQKYNVSVLYIPGNHDKTTSYYLAAYLKAWFRLNERVEIQDAPTSRKYETFGNTLVGFSHGDMTRMKDLSLLTLKENIERISNFKYIEHLCGHFHSEQVVENQGIKVRVLPSLCAPDSWHSDKGFTNNIQTCQGLLYSRNNGLEAIFYSKPVE